MRASTFERARQAVLDEMGWDDDRDAAGENWALAGTLVETIAAELSVKANPAAGRIARWRMTCAHQTASQGATS